MRVAMAAGVHLRSVPLRCQSELINGRNTLVTMVESPWVASLRPGMPVPRTGDEDVKALDKLLRQGTRIVGKYNGTDENELDCPARHEIALIGRSNVGKSSLLNALVRQPKLAATSRTPGRTTHVTFYGLGKAHSPVAAVVDMPGYGYAKRSQSLQSHWVHLMGEYLEHRPRSVLKRVIQLVDARLTIPGGAAGVPNAGGDASPARSVPPRSGKRQRASKLPSKADLSAAELTAELSAVPVQLLSQKQRVQVSQGRVTINDTIAKAVADVPLVSAAPDDCEAAQMLETVDVPWMIVLTKADLLSPAERHAAVSTLQPLADRPHGPLPHVYMVSAKTGEGVDELRDALAGSAGFGPLPGASRNRALARQQHRTHAAAMEAEQGKAQLRELGLDEAKPVLPVSELDRVH